MSNEKSNGEKKELIALGKAATRILHEMQIRLHLIALCSRHEGNLE